MTFPRRLERLRRWDAEPVAVVGRAARALEPVLAEAARERPGRLTGLGWRGAAILARLDRRPGRLDRFATDRPMGLAFVDVVGFTTFTARRGDDAAIELVALTQTLVEEAVALGRGEMVKSFGDGFLLAFPSPSQAVRAAILLARRAGSLREVDPLSGVDLRIAVHAGRPAVVNDDLLGYDVNLTAHLLEHCEPGEVVVSAAAKEVAAQRLSTVVFEAPRAVPVRGAPTDVEIFSARRTS
jgi:adenylate cyclase